MVLGAAADMYGDDAATTKDGGGRRRVDVDLTGGG